MWEYGRNWAKIYALVWISCCQRVEMRKNGDDLLLILTLGRFLLAEREGLEPPDGFPYRFSRPRRCRLRSTSPFFGCLTWDRTTRAFWAADLQSALAPYEIIRHPSWLRRQDLNPRPSAYEADELPDCSTAQFWREGTDSNRRPSYRAVPCCHGKTCFTGTL